MKKHYTIPISFTLNVPKGFKVPNKALAWFGEWLKAAAKDYEITGYTIDDVIWDECRIVPKNVKAGCVKIDDFEPLIKKPKEK